MLTVILLAAGALVLIGAIYLVMSSGKSGGRQGQSSEAEVVRQEQNSNPRGDKRANGSAND